MADDHTIHRLIVDDYPLKGFSTEPSTTISISTLLMQFFIARSPSMEGHYDRIRVDTAKVMKSIRLSGERLAESVLKSLVAAAEGTAWELLLRHDLEVYRRDARALDYSLITPADLAKVIDSKGPISVRDLRALTLMELHKVAAEIQSSPLNICIRPANTSSCRNLRRPWCPPNLSGHHFWPIKRIFHAPSAPYLQQIF